MNTQICDAQRTANKVSPIKIFLIYIIIKLSKDKDKVLKVKKRNLSTLRSFHILNRKFLSENLTFQEREE